MWAGYIALVNQQLAANGQPTIGFLNPTIYAQNVTSSYATDFHDITSGTSGSYSAVTGYDLVTGWGSPNAGLISRPHRLHHADTGLHPLRFAHIALRPAGQQREAPPSPPQSPADLTPPSLSPHPACPPESPSASAQLHRRAGSSHRQLHRSPTTAAGTYTITITGTGGDLTQTTTVSLTVTAAVQPSFTVSASASSITIARNAPGSVDITTTVSGGFNSAISLSASGQRQRRDHLLQSRIYRRSGVRLLDHERHRQQRTLPSAPTPSPSPRHRRRQHPYHHRHQSTSSGKQLAFAFLRALRAPLRPPSVTSNLNLSLLTVESTIPSKRQSKDCFFSVIFGD